MRNDDVRRLLADVGAEQPPPPDVEFLDRLEFELRAEVLASAADTAMAGAPPWRLPFGIAAAAFTVVVGVAGITVVKDLPDRHVSAQLARVVDADVRLPNGQLVPAVNGMVIPEGSLVHVPISGSAEIDGVELAAGQTVRLTEEGRLERVDPDGLQGDDGDNGPDQFVGGLPERGSGSSRTDSRVVVGNGVELGVDVPSDGNARTTSSTEASVEREGRHLTSTTVVGRDLVTGRDPQSTQSGATVTVPPATAPPTTTPSTVVVAPVPGDVQTTVSTDISTPVTAVPTTEGTTSTSTQPSPVVVTRAPPVVPTTNIAPPGGTTTTSTPDDVDPAGGTDPPGTTPGTAAPAGDAGADEEVAAGEQASTTPAGQADSDQVAAGDETAGDDSATGDDASGDDSATGDEAGDEAAGDEQTASADTGDSDA